MFFVTNRVKGREWDELERLALYSCFRSGWSLRRVR